MTRAGHVFLVTGASSGIGRATAVEASRDHHHVALVARGHEALEATAEQCYAAGAASVLVLPADVGEDDAVAGVVDRVLAAHSRIDVVVGAAGVVAYGRAEEVPVEVFDRVIRTNLLGSVNLARHVVPVLRRQRSGTLVLVGSVLGHVAVPSMTPYVVSKWGVRALARQLVIENHDVPGIRVRHVAPGGVDTPIYEQAANYAGFAGRPPPPAASAVRTAAQILRRVGPLPLPSQLSVFNHALVLGFEQLPWVYDAVITRLFQLGAMDLGTRVEPGPGNVLEPRPEGNRTGGAHDNLLAGFAGVARNVAAQARRAVPGG